MDTITHLLMLPPDARGTQVEALLRARNPNLKYDGKGTFTLGRHSKVVGPIDPDTGGPRLVSRSGEVVSDDDIVDVLETMSPRIREHWPIVFAIKTVIERDDDPCTGEYTDPDGMYRAFPAGLPDRAEGRILETCLAVARRLGGAIRAGCSGVMLVPDPQANIDLSVCSQYWVEPENLLQVVQRFAPQAVLALDAFEWNGPDVAEMHKYAPDRGVVQLSQEELVEIERVALRTDAEALMDSSLDRYSIYVDLAHYGSVEVLVSGDDEDVPLFQGTELEGERVAYALVWNPIDPIELTREEPSENHIKARSIAAQVVASLAVALQRSTKGAIVDSDGFTLDPAHLVVN